MSDKKTAIVTASRGIGAGLVEAFLNEGNNVDSSAERLVPNIPGLFSLLPKPSKSACCSVRLD
jgi:NAD(P)-dependent dehydrogenase (short-subunit alcohol dehydrogenase family)